MGKVIFWAILGLFISLIEGFLVYLAESMGESGIILIPFVVPFFIVAGILIRYSFLGYFVSLNSSGGYFIVQMIGFTGIGALVGYLRGGVSKKVKGIVSGIIILVLLISFGVPLYLQFSNSVSGGIENAQGIEHCKYILGLDKKNDCYYYLAKNTQDMEFCDFQSGEASKAFCKPVASGDLNYCFDYSSHQISYCIETVAQEVGASNGEIEEACERIKKTKDPTPQSAYDTSLRCKEKLLVN